MPCNMPRKRLAQNKGTPTGWRWKNGAWRYRVPKHARHLWDDKEEFTLGKTLPEAYATWAERVQVTDNIKTYNDLFDRYEQEILPTHSPSRQYQDKLYLVNLRAVFGHLALSALEPHHVYKYLDLRKVKKTDDSGKVKGGPVIANREVRRLSDIIDHGIRWGALKNHPFKGAVKLLPESARGRYVTNKELALFLSLPPSLTNYVKTEPEAGLPVPSI